MSLTNFGFSRSKRVADNDASDSKSTKHRKCDADDFDETGKLATMLLQIEHEI